MEEKMQKFWLHILLSTLVAWFSGANMMAQQTITWDFASLVPGSGDEKALTYSKSETISSNTYRVIDDIQNSLYLQERLLLQQTGGNNPADVGSTGNTYWYIRHKPNDNDYIGLFGHLGGDRHMIIKLAKGDAITFYTQGTEILTTKDNHLTQNDAVVAKDQKLTSGVKYSVNTTGNLTLLVTKSNYIQKIVIERPYDFDFAEKTGTVYIGYSASLPDIVRSEPINKNTVTYTSSDESIATVDETGKVHGLKTGEVTITATDSQLYYATCKVTVEDIPEEELYSYSYTSSTDTKKWTLGSNCSYSIYQDGWDDIISRSDGGGSRTSTLYWGEVVNDQTTYYVEFDAAFDLKTTDNKCELVLMGDHPSIAAGNFYDNGGGTKPLFTMSIAKYSESNWTCSNGEAITFTNAATQHYKFEITGNQLKYTIGGNTGELTFAKGWNAQGLCVSLGRAVGGGGNPSFNFKNLRIWKYMSVDPGIDVPTPTLTHAGTDYTADATVSHYGKGLTVTSSVPEGADAIWYRWGNAPATDDEIRADHQAGTTMESSTVQPTLCLTACAVKEIEGTYFLSEPVTLTFQLQTDSYFTYDYEDDNDHSQAWGMQEGTFTELSNTNGNDTKYGNYNNTGTGERGFMMPWKVTWGGKETYYVEFDMAINNSTTYDQNQEVVLLGGEVSTSNINNTMTSTGGNTIFRIEKKSGEKESKWRVTTNAGNSGEFTMADKAWYHFLIKVDSENKKMEYAITGSGVDVRSDSPVSFTGDPWAGGLRVVIKRANSFMFDNAKVWAIAPQAQAPIITPKATTYGYDEEASVTIAAQTEGSVLKYKVTSSSDKPAYDDTWTEGDSFSTKNYGDFYVHAVAIFDGEVSHVTSSEKITFTPPVINAPTLTAEGGSATVTADELNVKAEATLANGDTKGVTLWYRWDASATAASAMTPYNTQKAATNETTIPYLGEETETLTAVAVYTTSSGQRYFSDVSTLAVTGRTIEDAKHYTVVKWDYELEANTPAASSTGGTPTSKYDNGNTYGVYTGVSNGERASQILVEGMAKASNLYFVEFDAQVDFDERYGGNMEIALLSEQRTGSEIYKFSKAEIDNNKESQCMFRLTGAKVANNYGGSYWYVNATDPVSGVTDTEQARLQLQNQQWYHFKLAIDKATHSLSYRITSGKGKGGQLVENGAGTNFIPGDMVAEVIRVVTPRANSNTSTYYYVDDIEVWTEQLSEDVDYFYFPVDNKDGELIALEFYEPELQCNMSLKDLVDARRLTFTSSDESVAKLKSETNYDLMFINTGMTTITANLWAADDTQHTGTPEQTASYQVTVKADDATYKVEGNTYTLTGAGKLNERAVTTVPGIEMYFGNEMDFNLSAEEKRTKLDNGSVARNTTIVRYETIGEEKQLVATTIEQRGWRHMRPEIEKNEDGTNKVITVGAEEVDKPTSPLLPVEGTFYRFVPKTDGKLTLKGARTTNNTVVLMKAVKDSEGNITGWTNVQTIDQDGMVTTDRIELTYGDEYYLYANIPGSGGNATGAHQYFKKDNDTYYIYKDANGNYYYRHETNQHYYTKDENDNMTQLSSKEENALGTLEEVHGEQWSIFQLQSFSYETDFHFTKKHFRHDNADDLTALGGDDNLGQEVEGFQTGDGGSSYEIQGLGNITATIDATTGKISNVKAADESKPMGGALIVTATHNTTDNYQVSYAITYPYATNKWDFMQVAVGDENGMKRLRESGADWGITYKVRNYDEVTRALGYLNKPVLTNNEPLEGENALYMRETAGLVITADVKNFGTNVEADTLKANGYELNSQYYTPQYWVKYLWAQGLTDDHTVRKSTDGDYVRQMDFALQTMLAYKKGDVINPNLLTVGAGATVTIPNLKKGQFVIMRLNRHGPSAGAYFDLQNLTALDTYLAGGDNPKEIGNTGTSSGTSFTITGVNEVGGVYSNQGAYVFRVVKDGDVSFRTLNGWVDIYDIEVANEKKSDLRFVTRSGKELTPDDCSVAYTGTLSSADGATFTLGTGSTLCQFPRVTNFDLEISSDDFEVEAVNHVSGNNKRTPKSTVAAGQETFRITGVKSGKTGYGNVKVTMNIYDQSGKYLVDRRDLWIAVGKLEKHAYPVTWDFTNRNLARTAANSAFSTKTTQDGYGRWDGQKLDLLTQVPDVDGLNTEKPTFASGAQLTGGSDGKTVIDETQGLGVGLLDKASAEFEDLIDQEPLTEDNRMTGVLHFHAEGYLTVPSITASETQPTYVYIQADKEVTATDQDGNEVAATTADFAAKDGAYGFKVTKDATVRLNIPADTKVRRVGVTDIVKQLAAVGEAAYATESRDVSIDHLLTGEFTTNETKAYTVKYGSYNRENATVTPTEIEVVPDHTGIYLKNEGGKSVGVPLFREALNVPKDVATDNMLKDNVEARTDFKDETEDGNGNNQGLTGSKTRFIFSARYYTYNKGTDTSSEQKTALEPAFYRMKGGGSGIMRANTAYMLVNTDDLPTALWNTGNGQSNVKGYIMLSFPDTDQDASVATHIDAQEAETDTTASYYTLDGVKLNGTPKKKGLYVRNGKKVVIQ